VTEPEHIASSGKDFLVTAVLPVILRLADSTKEGRKWVISSG